MLTTTGMTQALAAVMHGWASAADGGALPRRRCTGHGS